MSNKIIEHKYWTVKDKQFWDYEEALEYKNFLDRTNSFLSVTNGYIRSAHVPNTPKNAEIIKILERREQMAKEFVYKKTGFSGFGGWKRALRILENEDLSNEYTRYELKEIHSILAYFRSEIERQKKLDKASREANEPPFEVRMG